MTLAAEKEYQHVGRTRGCEDCHRDIIHELSKRLDALWRYDQYIANASGHDDLQAYWRECKRQDQENVNTLKKLLRNEITSDSF